MGGTDNKNNIERLTVQEHAKAHLKLYTKYGKREDLLAYNALSKRIPKEKIIRERCSLGGKFHKGKKQSKLHILKKAKSRQIITTWYHEVYAPFGIKCSAKQLHDKFKEQNLLRYCLSFVRTEKKKNYKGWSIYRIETKYRKKRYVWYHIDSCPEGVTKTIPELILSFSDLQLKDGALYNVAHGKKQQYKGWTIIKSDFIKRFGSQHFYALRKSKRSVTTCSPGFCSLQLTAS